MADAPLSTQRDSGFAAALSASIPVAAAYVPLGAAKAIMMLGVGMDWYWPIVTAVIVYAGSLEFLIVSYVASGMSLPLVAWTTFLVNFRHLFYGLSYPLHKHWRIPEKLYGMFALTDEVYVVTALGRGKHFDGRTLLIFQGLLQFWWFSGACLGVLVGQWLPEGFGGFEFALTAMFVILSYDSLQKTRSVIALIFTGISIIFGYLYEFFWQPDSFLIAGLVLYFLLLNGEFFYRKARGHVAG